METKINLNIGFFPAGAFSYRETLGPPLNDVSENDSNKPTYDFPTNTGPTRSPIIYSPCFVDIR